MFTLLVRLKLSNFPPNNDEKLLLVTALSTYVTLFIEYNNWHVMLWKRKFKTIRETLRKVAFPRWRIPDCSPSSWPYICIQVAVRSEISIQKSGAHKISIYSENALPLEAILATLYGGYLWHLTVEYCIGQISRTIRLRFGVLTSCPRKNFIAHTFYVTEMHEIWNLLMVGW